MFQTPCAPRISPFLSFLPKNLAPESYTKCKKLAKSLEEPGMFILTESYTTWSDQQWVGILADLLLDAESVPSTVNHKAGKYQWGPSRTRTSPAGGLCQAKESRHYSE